MSIEATSDPRKAALDALAANFKKQGHPDQYAQVLATTVIFQADLDLRNAQLSRILNWLKQEKNDIYEVAIDIVENTRHEFENRVQKG